MSDPSTLVVGGSGFLGRNLLRRIAGPAVATYRSSTDFARFCASLGKGIEAVRVDLSSDDFQLQRSWRTCIYLAGHVRLRDTELRLEKDLEENVLPLARFLRSVEIERLIYLSSGAVYEGATGKVSPRTAISPTLPYSISKLAGERAVEHAHRRLRAVASYATVRFFGAFGPWEPSFKLYTRCITAIARGDRQLECYGDGSNLIDAMPVDDAVDALTRLSGTGELHNEVIDLAMGQPMTVASCVAEIAQTLGADLEPVFAGTSPEAIQFWSSSERFREVSGWHGPQGDRRAGILALAEWLAGVSS